MEDGRGSSLATGSGDSDRYEVVGDIDADSPKDKKSLVLVMMTLCGAGFLFPFNSYIGAVDFLEERYPSFSPEFVIPFVRESTVSFFFSFFSSLSHFYLFLFLEMWYADGLPTYTCIHAGTLARCRYIFTLRASLLDQTSCKIPTFPSLKGIQFLISFLHSECKKHTRAPT